MNRPSGNVSPAHPEVEAPAGAEVPVVPLGRLAVWRRALPGAARTLQLPFWSLLQAATQMGVALLSARWRGPTERGELVLATTIATLLLLVSSVGTGTAARVVLAETDRWWNWARYERLAAVLTVPHLALSATVGLFVLSRFAEPAVGTELAFLGFSATALAAHLYREGMHGLGRHRTSFVVDVAAASIQLILTWAVYAMDDYSAAMALWIGCFCYAAAIAVETVIGRLADRQGRFFPRVTVREWWQRVGALLRFSRPALVMALGQSYVVIGDRLLVGMLGETSQVGLYSAAASFATLASIAPTALTALLTRRTAEHGSLEVWRRIRLPVVALTAAAALGVTAVGWVAIPILLGEEFVPARALLPLLCAAAIPYGSWQIDSAACAGLRDLRTGAVTALVGCVALSVLAAVGFALLGTVGVTGGVLITYTLMAAIARGRVRRLIARQQTA